MKNPRFAAVAVAMFFFGVSVSQAAPITYDMRFDALLGPSGTGSFEYDQDTQHLTNLTWDFGGGIVGGFSLTAFINPITGASSDSFLAELLIRTDLNPAGCAAPVIGNCRYSYSGPLGITPGGVNGFVVQTSLAFGSDTYYSFSTITSTPFVPGVPPTPPVIGASAANGYVRTTARVAVPEANALWLVSLGLVVLGVSRRRLSL